MPVHDPSDLMFIVWMNPDHPKKPQSRLLVTHFDSTSHLPLAFIAKNLRNSSFFANLPIQSPETIAEALLASTARNPVLVPVSLAAAQLGWYQYTVSHDTFGA